MLAFVYLLLVLAFSAALLRHRAVRYEREHQLVPQPLRSRSGRLTHLRR
jgi:hypothetical protein